jgi:hypothetical protein
MEILRSDGMGRSYAGIGSRSTPSSTLSLIQRLGELFAKRGWVVRTGGAPGADRAFIDGAQAGGGEVELYLPWRGFQGLRDATLDSPSVEATALAERFHPAWNRCGKGARLLHGRNSHQVLGVGLDSPVAFLACWTPDGSLDGQGRRVGGTGQALRIASSLDVPIVNLARDQHREQVEALVARAES